MSNSETGPRKQIILVLQGGGALGAYQAGVYQALHEAGLEPDWVIGTSIGAINAGLIAGNKVESRLTRLREFWQRVEYAPYLNWMAALPGGEQLAHWTTMTTGLGGFFCPNLGALFGTVWPLGAENASHYKTDPLRKVISQLVDFDEINRRATRISVGAANVCTGEMHYFDSRDREFTIDHVMASGALPPAFPAVQIDGDLYWDGGILSNTPLEAIFDDHPRHDALIFSVNMWNPAGPAPATIRDVLTRQKDIQFASRSQNQVMRQAQIHKLRHVINELMEHVPEAEKASAIVRELAGYGCVTKMHIVSLQAPMLDREDHLKDIDFSGASIHQRWEAGYEQTRTALSLAPWDAPSNPLEGVILHQLPANG